MKSGKVFVVIRNEGMLKEGMSFTFLAYENDFVYLWSHKPILSMNQFKFPIENIKRNFRII